MSIIFIRGFYRGMENSSVSFTSNICFVDRIAYNKIKKRNSIGFWHTVPNILKADEFYSEGIKTCTGGGIVIPFKEAEGFHFWDDMTNKKKFPDIVNSLFRFVKNPQRALLVGSKNLDDSPYSIEQFERFKKVFTERIKNVSLFERHRYENAQTHYIYSLNDDTWTLFSEYQKGKNIRYNQVKNLKALKECFENISIADGDRLFINNKEITKADAPELFQ